MSEGQTQRTEEERHILVMVKWLLYLVFVVVAYLIVRVLGPVLTPLLAAAGVAYLLDGAVDRLVRRGLNRTAVVAGLLFGFVALVVGLIVLVAPLVVKEIEAFVAALPGLVERTSHWLASEFGIEMPSDWKAFLEGKEVRSFLESAAVPASKVAAAALGGALGFLGWLAELLLVPVFAFYFLVDWDHIVARAHAFVPPRHRGRVADIAREIDVAVSSWIRGQLTVMAVLAALYALAFKIIGIHLGITIGVVVGLLTVIPFLGTFVGAGLALVMVMLDWQGAGQLAAVGAVFVVLHLLEAAVLTPRLVGKRVGLGEVGALFAVLAGGQLLGFAGVLLAVPIAASIAVLIRRAIRYYEATPFFVEGSELVPAPVGPAPPPRRPTGTLSSQPPPRAGELPVLDPLHPPDPHSPPDPLPDPLPDPDLDAARARDSAVTEPTPLRRSRALRPIPAREKADTEPAPPPPQPGDDKETS